MDHSNSDSWSIADYLVSGFWDSIGMPAPTLADPTNLIKVDLTGLAPEAVTLARGALETWASVADLHFEEVTSGADIVLTDEAQGAWTDFIRDSASGEITAHIDIGQSWIDRYGTSVGCYAFQTYIHEIGHALGLGHPGAYDGTADYATDALFPLDSWQQSVMSYFSQTTNTAINASLAFCVTPMMADIIAIQRLYGAPKDGVSAGSTTWGYGSDPGTCLGSLFAQPGRKLSMVALTIFDESGTDTLDLSQDDRGQVIRLRAGSFSDVLGGRGNLAVAEGTLLERCLSGAGDDRVTGNGARNEIILGQGNDRSWGLSEADQIFGGTGDDSLFGGSGEDRLAGDSGTDLLNGDDGGDRLLGGGGADSLQAGFGDDVLWGGTGSFWPSPFGRARTSRGALSCSASRRWRTGMPYCASLTEASCALPPSPTSRD